MSDSGPEPAAPEPTEEAQPAPQDGWPATVEKWLAAYIYTSPYHTPNDTSNPFSAGFQAALSHFRNALLNNPPKDSAQ